VIVEYKDVFSLPVLNAISPNGVTVVGRQRMTMEPYGTCDGKPDDPGGDGTGLGATATATQTNTPVPTATPALPWYCYVWPVLCGL